MHVRTIHCRINVSPRQNLYFLSRFTNGSEKRFGNFGYLEEEENRNRQGNRVFTVTMQIEDSCTLIN